MHATCLSIPDVVLIDPQVFEGDRVFFFESFNQAHFEEAIDRPATFVQDNHSRSAKNVLRGLRYNINQSQGKLISVVQGEVFDVAVDLRKNSPTFGRWVAEVLSAENKPQLSVSEGFVVVSDTAKFLYKTTDYYSPAFERSIAWDDPSLGIQWPAGVAPILSAKDAYRQAFAQAEVFA